MTCSMSGKQKHTISQQVMKYSQHFIYSFVYKDMNLIFSWHDFQMNASSTVHIQVNNNKYATSIYTLVIKILAGLGTKLD